jgi:hypothetical protein
LNAICAPFDISNTTRHAKMHQQHIARREIGQEVFRPPAEPGHRLALEPLGEILRQRPAKIAAPRLHMRKARALHDGRKAPPYRLDLGQFRHD